MIAGYWGILGCGKTIAALQQAIILLIKNHRRGNNDYKLYANIKLTLPAIYQKHFVFIKSYEQIRELINGAFLFDEMWQWVDSRVSTSKKNRFWSMWSVKTRKKNVDLLYTEQKRNMIDPRIREITKYLCKPSQHVVDYKLSITNKYRNIIYKYTKVTVTDLKVDIPPKTYYVKNATYFKLYNTFEEPEELEGGTYIDEGDYLLANEIPNDKVIDIFKTKGEKIEHIMGLYKCGKQTATYVWYKMDA